MALNFNQNRLRFVHCENVFANANEVRTYIKKSRLDRPYLFAEPCVYLYGDAEDPKVILTIGSVGDGTFQTNEQGEMLNRIFIIDFAQVEQDIETIKNELKSDKEAIEELQGLVKNIIAACGLDEEGNYIPLYGNQIIKDATSLFEADKMLAEYVISLEKQSKLIAVETPSIKPTINVSEDGTEVSADVKRGSKVYGGKVINNIITERQDGIFVNIDVDYDAEESQLNLIVNGGDTSDNGFVKTIQLPKEVHIVNGSYDKYEEEIVLELNTETVLKDGSVSKEIRFDVKDLIDEIVVVGEESTTPIVLTKVSVKTSKHGHGDTEEYVHAISGDIRIFDGPFNILRRTENGKALYVEGTAANIKYGNKTVKAALDEMSKYTKISLDNDNIIKLNQDGLFADVKVSYNAATNELTFATSNQEPITWKLNAAQFIEGARYDASTQELVITYLDTSKKVQEVRINLKDLIEIWMVDNVNTTVTLEKNIDASGNIKVRGNVNIAKLDDNILSVVSAGTNSSHMLYVKGSADNIKVESELFASTDVEGALNELSRSNTKAIVDESERATKAEDKLSERIGDEETRAYEAEQALEEKLNDAKTKLTKHFLNSQSIDFKVSKHDDGSEDVMAMVVIDNTPENLLEMGDKALRVTAQLNYNSNTRELSLKGSNGVKSTIVLPTVEIIEDIYYDQTTKSLVLVYTDSEGRKKKVFIDIRDLFNEWTVDNTKGGAVTLTKTLATEASGYDKLSAEVNISKLSSNLLVNDNGNLYVSNEAKKIVLASGKNLEDTVQSLLMKDIDLTQAITNEETRAINEEQKIAHALSDETERATKAENVLNSKIDGEIARAKGREDGIQGDLNSTNITLQNEIDRAATAEKELSIAISGETTRALSAETRVQTNLETEISNRINAISALTRDLSDEAAERARVDKALGDEIDALGNEDTRLGNLIATNDGRAQEAENVLDEKIDGVVESLKDETKNRKDADEEINRNLTTLKTIVDGEIARAASKDEEHGLAINAINTRLGEISSDTAVTFSSTPTLELSKNENKDVQGNVRISKTDKNIINAQVDGIYATVDLSYEIGANKLTLTSSNGLTSEVTLQSVSVIKDITYVANTDKIEITYTDGQGQDRTTSFDAANLFKPITADNTNTNVEVSVANDKNYVVSANLDVNNIIDNTNSTVKLSKDNNNKIVANVKISDRTDNALKVDAANLLYVSNNASDISLDGETTILGKNVNEALDALNEAIKDANGKITEVKGIAFDDNVLTLTYADSEGNEHEIACDMNLDITDKITSSSDVDHNVKFEISKDEETQTTFIVGDVDYFDCGEY